MPLYTETGAINVVSNDTTKGRYSPTGALRINLVSGASYTGLYAADGAVNVVDISGVSISTYGGLYHPCGALRGRTAPNTYSGLQAPDGSYYFNGLFSPINLFSNGEVGGWYDPSDLTTLFQDAAGTTPVTAVEQPVGLVLDKRSAAFSQSFNGTSNNITIGSMPDALKLGTGDFTIEFFVKTNGTSVYSICGNLNDDSGSGHYWVILNSSYTGLHTVQFSAASTLYKFGTSALSTGAWHHIAITRSGSNLRCFLNGSQLGATGAISDFTGTYNNFVIGSNTTGAGNRYWLNGNLSNLRIVKGSALYTSSFSVPASALTAVSGTVLLCCGNNTFSSNPSLSYNGVVANGSSPFSAIDGNHLSQSTSTARPVLSARVNLLTQTEDFSAAAWVKDNAGIGAAPTISPDSTTAPNGTQTADTFTQSSTSSGAFCYQSVSITAGTQIQAVLNVKQNSGTWLRFAVFDSAISNGIGGWVNLSNGQVGTTPGTIGSGTTFTSLTSEPAGNGFYRIVLKGTIGSATTIYGPLFFISDADNSGTRLNSGSCFVWGADLRPANAGVGLPAYQRVTTSTDYDTTGFPLYLKFDGTDDSLSSGSIDFTSTDKMSVFAGARKMSDGAGAMLVELSSVFGSNAGSFFLTQGDYNTGTGARWQYAQRGTAAADTSLSAQSPTNYAAPITSVLSGYGDISTDTCIVRVNGTQQASVTADQGSGNFGNYPLYVGSRGGSSLRFNGQLYSLIVRGAATDAATIASTETWVNSKTGAY